MKKLIPMTDFVLECSNESILNLTFEESLKKSIKITKEIFEYANFLRQPLKLEMFVPCDEDGNVLEEPKNSQYPESLCNFCPLEKKGAYGVDGGYMAGCEGSKCDSARDNYDEKYQKAKEKVVFEGFEVIEKEITNIKHYVYLRKKNELQISFFENNLFVFIKCFQTYKKEQIKTIEDLIPYNLEIK
jgi:hypothetical protein